MERVNRAKAIRLKCLDCCCGSSNEVSLCPSKECPLWRYRRGKEEHDELYYASHKTKNQNEEVEVEEND